MYIYRVEWYNEDDYGPTNYTNIVFISHKELNRKERIEEGLNHLYRKCMSTGSRGVDVGVYDKVSAVRVKDQVLSCTVEGGINNYVK